jgi:hypothetical protein
MIVKTFGFHNNSVAVCSEDMIVPLVGETVLRPKRPLQESIMSLIMQQRHLLPVIFLVSFVSTIDFSIDTFSISFVYIHYFNEQ